MRILFAVTFVFLSASHHAWCAPPLSESPVPAISTQVIHAPSFRTPLGLGILAGDASNQSQIAAVIEGQNHFTQRRGAYGLRQYGHGFSRAELGDEFGVALGSTSGVVLLGLDREATGASAFAGLEPFSGGLTWTTQNQRRRYYEWLPMASAGGQFGFATCRLLSVVRAGGAVGSFLKSGLAPAFGLSYGLGSYLNCPGFDIAADLTRIQSGGRRGDLRLFDVAYAVSSTLKLGMRGESESDRGWGGDAEEHGEQRLLLVLRTQIRE